MKCKHCQGWENCPIRKGDLCVPVRKVRKEKKRRGL